MSHVQRKLAKMESDLEDQRKLVADTQRVLAEMEVKQGDAKAEIEAIKAELQATIQSVLPPGQPPEPGDVDF